jgi:rubrerythrin
MNEKDFKGMAGVEKAYYDRLVNSAKEITNPVVKVVMEAVAQDSLKHSIMYEVIAELLKVRPMISEVELEKIASEIEHHIKTEEEMINYLKKLLEGGVENKAVKFLLEAILKDEVFHHSLLKNVLEMIVRRESFTESDAWELVWKDVASHGTPSTG